MWVQERERFSGQREKVRPIIILSEMDICSDPSKLDRTCNHVHPSEERVYFFLWSLSKKYVLLSFTVPRVSSTFQWQYTKKHRCDDIPWCFGSHPGPHAAQISHPEFSHSAEKEGDWLVLWSKNRAQCSLL